MKIVSSLRVMKNDFLVKRKILVFHQHLYNKTYINYINVNKNALQNSLTNSNKTKPHNKKKTPFTPFSLEERNWFSRGLSLGIRRIECLIDNSRATLT